MPNVTYLSINQTLDQDIETAIELREAKIGAVSGKVLHSHDPRDHNSLDTPKAVTPKRLKLGEVKGELVHRFPAHSFTSLTITLG